LVGIFSLGAGLVDKVCKNLSSRTTGFWFFAFH